MIAARRGGRGARAFLADSRAASAVEFGMVAAPFIFTLLEILQVGIFYMTQSALDAGMIRTADALRITFTTGANPTFPTASGLKTSVASNSGGLLSSNGTLAVEIRQLSTLAAANVAIVDGVVDYGSTTSALVLRAQATVVTFAPGFSSLAQVRSSAIVRRQGR